MTVFGPALELGHPGTNAHPHLLITTRPAAPTRLAPLRLRSARYRREMPTVKHTGLFGALSQRRIAQRSGYHDVLFTDAGGTISDGATANIGALTGEEII